MVKYAPFISTEYLLNREVSSSHFPVSGVNQCQLEAHKTRRFDLILDPDDLDEFLLLIKSEPHFVLKASSQLQCLQRQYYYSDTCLETTCLERPQFSVTRRSMC